MRSLARDARLTAGGQRHVCHHHIRCRTRSAFTAAASTGREAASISHDQGASQKRTVYSGLVQALTKQFQKEAAPWLMDILVPLLSVGPPPPLQGTVPPEQLADAHSRFANIHGGMKIHYKEWTGSKGAAAVSTSTAAATSHRAGPTVQHPASNQSSTASTESRPMPPAANLPISTTSAAPLSSPHSTRGVVMSVAVEAATDALVEDVATADFNASNVDLKTVMPAPTPGTSTSTSTSSMHAAPQPPDVLLLHGLNGSEFSWRLIGSQLAQALADGSAAAAYHGGSSDGSEAAAASNTQPGQGSVGSYLGQQQQQQAEAADHQQPVRVVAYDRPPYGLSSRPAVWTGDPVEDPYTNEGGAVIARAMAESLGLGTAPGVGGKVVICGHSAGGPIAMQVAVMYPELVAGVVLIAPAISAPPPPQDATDASKGGKPAARAGGPFANADVGQLLRLAVLAGLILPRDGPGLRYVRRQVQRRAEEVKAGKLGGIYADANEHTTQEVIEGYLRPMLAHDWDIGMLNATRRGVAAYTGGAFGGGSKHHKGHTSSKHKDNNNNSKNQLPAWANVNVPVLVIQGVEDNAVPASMAQGVVNTLRAVRADQPGAAAVEYLELKKCGHLPMEEFPSDVTEAMASFILQHCRTQECQQQ